MLFNSLEFAIFLALFCCIYYPLRRHFRAQNMLIIAASYIFYGWWDVRFLQLILISTALDFMSALMDQSSGARPGPDPNACLLRARFLWELRPHPWRRLPGILSLPARVP